MGLAPYGKPRSVQTILENLLDLKDDGTFRLNMRYFDFTVGLNMTSAYRNTLYQEFSEVITHDEAGT